PGASPAEPRVPARPLDAPPSGLRAPPRTSGAPRPAKGDAPSCEARDHPAHRIRMIPSAEATGPVTSDRVMRIQGGFQASAILAAGATHRIFTHIERGAATVEDIAAQAGISLRGAQALLDGLTGLG